MTWAVCNYFKDRLRFAKTRFERTMEDGEHLVDIFFQGGGEAIDREIREVCLVRRHCREPLLSVDASSFIKVMLCL